MSVLKQKHPPELIDRQVELSHATGCTSGHNSEKGAEAKVGETKKKKSLWGRLMGNVGGVENGVGDNSGGRDAFESGGEGGGTSEPTFSFNFQI